MAEATLVEQRIEAGGGLLKELDEAGFKVNSALWFYAPDSDTWLLILASPVIDEKGPKEAYSSVQKVLANVSPTLPISLKEISIISPEHELIRLLRLAIRTGPGISGIRFSRNTINGVFISDAYIYRVQGPARTISDG